MSEFEFEAMGGTIEFPSNGGRDRILFRPRSMSATDFVADIRITFESFEDVRTSELYLQAVAISRERFLQLNVLLLHWLDTPSSFDIELVQSKWASLQLTVGPDPAYSRLIEKPAVRVDIDWCGISAVAVMVVDQTCVRNFQEGVSKWLRLDGATTE